MDGCVDGGVARRETRGERSGGRNADYKSDAKDDALKLIQDIRYEHVEGLRLWEHFARQHKGVPTTVH